ncbi:hypothetical protein DFH09DRAFT_1317147 [Mycena vulgaris]|nr:hypothetical protein DFH09DRAFT_1317147 [Mycena vulgaris]
MLLHYHVYPAQKRDITAPPEHASMRRCWDFLDNDQPQLCVRIPLLVLPRLPLARHDRSVKQPLLRDFHTPTLAPGSTSTLSLPASPSRRREALEYPAVSEAPRGVPRRHPEHHSVGMVDFAARASAFSSSTASNSDEKRTGAAAPGLETIAAYDIYHYVASHGQLHARRGGRTSDRDGAEDVRERRCFWPPEIWVWGRYGRGLASMEEMCAGVSSASQALTRFENAGYPGEKNAHPTSSATERAAHVLSATLLAALRPPPRARRAQSTASASSRPSAAPSPHDARAVFWNPWGWSGCFGGM